MKQCVIFCAAGFDGLIAPIGADALVIAADGGLRHTQALGLFGSSAVGNGFIRSESSQHPPHQRKNEKIPRHDGNHASVSDSLIVIDTFRNA